MRNPGASAGALYGKNVILIILCNQQRFHQGKRIAESWAICEFFREIPNSRMCLEGSRVVKTLLKKANRRRHTGVADALFFQRLTLSQYLRQMPERFVQPHGFIEASNSASA